MIKLLWKKRLLENNIIIFLLLFSFIKPDSLNQFVLFDNMINLVKVTAFFFIFIMYLHRKKYSKCLILIILYYLVYFISTIIHNGEIYRFFLELFNILGLLMLTEIYLDNNILKFLRVFSYWGTVLSIINIISILMFPEGIYFSELTHNPCFFLGHRNVASQWMIFFIGITVLYTYLKRRRLSIHCIIMFSVGLLNILLVWSATSLIAYLFFSIMLLLSFLKFKKFFCSYVLSLTGSVIMSFLIIIVHIQDKFLYIIQSLLHRDLSFSGRQAVWNGSLYYISQSLWIGFGTESSEKLIGKIFLESTHNFYLQITYNAGLIGLAIVFVWLIYIGKQLKQCREIIISGIFLSIYTSIFIIWIVESTLGSTFEFIALTSILACNTYKLQQILL